MSQKSSLPQAAKSVSRVLMSDTAEISDAPLVRASHMCLIAVILAVTSFGATDHKSCAAIRPVNYVGTKSLRTTVVTRCTNDT